MDEEGATVVSDADVSRLLGEIGRPDAVSSVDHLDEWSGRATLTETAAGERYRLFHFPDAGGRAQKEASVLDRVRRETDVPVPTVVGLDPLGEFVPVPTLVVRDRGGLPVFDIAGLAPPNQADLFFAFGSALAELHRIEFDGFGPIGADGASVIEGERTWQEWFEPRLRRRIEALNGGPFESYVESASDLFERHRADLDRGFDASLAKASYRFEQLLVDSNRDPILRAVRGYDRSIAAPAEYGFAAAHWSVCERAFRSPSFREAFETGYRGDPVASFDPRADRRRTLYRLERLLNEIHGLDRTVETDRIGEDEAARRRTRLRDHLDRVLDG